MRTKVFISHSRSDEAFAQRLSEALNRSGISTWSHSGMAPGTSWADHLRRAIEGSSAVIALMTSESTRNAAVMSEVGAAFAARKPVIPIIPRDHRVPQNLPAGLRDTAMLRVGNSSDDEVAAAVMDRLENLVPLHSQESAQ